MKKGDIVYIKYVGRVKETGEIFDVTDEEIAKKENVYNPEVRYGDVPVVVGGGFLLPGLDEALLEMNVGEKKKVEVPPEKGFGNRKMELIKLIPLTSFKSQNIDATPGSYISVNGMSGRILSVSGGRVKVDFNHPLAGKTLIYDIEIKKHVTNTEDKVFALIKYFSGADRKNVDLSISDGVAKIEIKGMDVAKRVKTLIARNVLKWIDEIEKVQFLETYEKQEFKHDDKK